jgi:predicted AAA+ superfamily ATPase
LFQKLVETPNSIYISLDWWFLKGFSLYDIVKELYKTYKITNFFLDEIHFYSNWTVDLKNIYDVLPVKVVFSGSNKIWLYDLGADLSRRVIFYKIPIFSFREFLNLEYWFDLPALSFKEIFDQSSYKEYLSKISLMQLKRYFQIWQLWIYYENKKNYQLKLLQITRKMIYEDSIILWKPQQIDHLEKILFFVANTVQNQISYTSLAKKLWVHPKTVEKYLKLLEKVWLFYSIPKYWNISDLLRKEIKPYFSSTNFIYLFATESSDLVWKLRENFFVSMIKEFDDDIKIYFKTTTDFIVNYNWKIYEFEIWWKSKRRKDVFVVKDDILIWNDIEIPLWVFGMLW